MTPERDFLGPNPVSAGIFRTLDIFNSTKISCMPSFRERSGIFNDHGRKREDPGNKVATT